MTSSWKRQLDESSPDEKAETCSGKRTEEKYLKWM